MGKGATKPVYNYCFCMETEIIIIIYRGLSIHKGIILALETGEFVM
jgi:hypothetical protein